MPNEVCAKIKTIINKDINEDYEYECDCEYEYKLKDDNNVYSSGLVRIGDYTPERIEYENEIKYKYQRDI